MLKEEEEIENQEIARRYKEMLKDSYQDLSKEDLLLIRKAFDFALNAHSGQRRKSGEPYIHHPLEVAKIVADEIGLGATSIAAALLHDVVEDTDYTIEDIEKQFDKNIASIIDGLTKISVINNQEVSLQSENYKKLLLTLSNDVRVILIKIADRLHNMRTLDMVAEHKQRKASSETLFIYAPLAHRLGLYGIKTELENLSLKYTEPDSYKEIEHLLEESKEKREKYIEDFIQVLKEKLDEEGLDYTIKGRPKSIFSIHKKMVSQEIPFDQVFDLFAIRVIYKAKNEKDEKFLAWKIYSIVTDVFKPNPKRMRDWISQPKSTGYESLHATVMGHMGRWVEVQIRSDRMDEIAERGVAAHYKYKEGIEKEESNIDTWVERVREFLENNDGESTEDFIDNFKLTLYTKEIYAFTPKGDLLSLPKGATALDFAYDIHSRVGDHCLGAKVNGKLVPLSHVLQSGDQVEIITSEQQKPKANWLSFAITSKARAKIKNALNSEKRTISDDGREALSRKLRHLKVTMTEETVNSMMRFFKEKTSQDLFYKIAIGEINNSDIKDYVDKKSGNIYHILNRFRRRPSREKENLLKEEDAGKYDLLVFGPDEEKLDYQIASCCSPIPGDKVFGFLTHNKGIKVHKDNCPNSINMRANYAYRIINAKWIDSKNREEFFAVIQVEGIDRLGLINELSEKLSKMKINIRSLNIDSNDGVFKGKISLVVQNKNHLNEVMTLIGKIEGVGKVSRKFNNVTYDLSKKNKL